MNQHLKAILAISSLAFSKALIAGNMTEHEYKAAAKNIRAEYNLARINCGTFAGSDKSICMTVAKSRKKTAKAELSAAYAPASESTYPINHASVDKTYRVSSQPCDPLITGKNGKQLAKDTRPHSPSDADTQLKTMRDIERYDARIIDTHPKSKQEDD